MKCITTFDLYRCFSKCNLVFILITPIENAVTDDKTDDVSPVMNKLAELSTKHEERLDKMDVVLEKVVDVLGFMKTLVESNNSETDKKKETLNEHLNTYNNTMAGEYIPTY